MGYQEQMKSRGDEGMNKSRINLQEEIILFRYKLDNLLATMPLHCMEVQEMSVRLDELIAEYYFQKEA